MCVVPVPSPDWHHLPDVCACDAAAAAAGAASVTRLNPALAHITRCSLHTQQLYKDHTTRVRASPSRPMKPCCLASSSLSTERWATAARGGRRQTNGGCDSDARPETNNNSAGTPHTTQPAHAPPTRLSPPPHRSAAPTSNPRARLLISCLHHQTLILLQVLRPSASKQLLSLEELSQVEQLGGRRPDAHGEAEDGKPGDARVGLLCVCVRCVVCEAWCARRGV
jgi:hypothetical protein